MSALRDRLFRALTRPPFRDAEGRKGWLSPFAHAQPHAVRQIALTLPGWPVWKRPLRIAFLSDFHVGSHTDDVARLARIVEEARERQPDLALYGGDFVNLIPFGGGRVPPETVAAVLARLDAPLGRVAVLGNHDRNYGPDDVTKALRANGITVLFDSVHEVAFEGSGVPIVGIHDARRNRLESHAVLTKLDASNPAIVLAHDPHWFAHLPAGPHLMLAGHTHGGQICLPGYGPLRNASWAPLRWTYGMIVEGGKRMYVTSGLGCSALPLRVAARPEWVLLELNGAGAAYG
jgi:predicted MPP superfamily phosphohydrolase